MLIYKILLPTEWAQFEEAGSFDGSPFDRASGFIHCSSRKQVGATAMRVFADEPSLVVVAIHAGRLGESLRWDTAPNGSPFPHVYAPVPLSAVATTHTVAGARSVDAVLPKDC